MSDAVLFERRGPAGWITLNRPEQRNTMSPDLLAGFEAAIERARGEPDLRCLVVAGAGRAFCAGADFASLGAGLRDLRGPAAAQPGAQPGAPPSLPETLRRVYGAFLRVLDVEVPTVAAIHGAAVGGGFGLALLCDLRVAARDAKMGANFVRLGLHPGLGISYLLPRLVGHPRAAELILTGRLIDGEEAGRIGLCCRVVARDDVAAEAQRLAEEIAANAPIAVREARATLRQAAGWDLSATLAREAEAQARTLATEDVQEGIRAMLDKRAPEFRGR